MEVIDRNKVEVPSLGPNDQFLPKRTSQKTISDHSNTAAAASVARNNQDIGPNANAGTRIVPAKVPATYS